MAQDLKVKEAEARAQSKAATKMGRSQTAEGDLLASLRGVVNSYRACNLVLRLLLQNHPGDIVVDGEA